MSYDGASAGALDYAPCKYGESQLVFRGPERRLDAPYVAFVGGNETYGKYIKSPYPALVESDLGLNCINFGIQNAGVDVFLNDDALLALASRAEVTVLQIVGAHNLSNRFYSVHPRRNDRFVCASDQMRQTFPEVDFAEYHFTKHMLSDLHTVSKERFALVLAEIQIAWLARMKTLIKRLGTKVVLVWFADHRPLAEDELILNPSDARDPLFVSAKMLDALRAHCSDIVEVAASEHALKAGTQGMVVSEIESLAAQELLGPKAHGELAAQLGRVLKGLI